MAFENCNKIVLLIKTTTRLFNYEMILLFDLQRMEEMLHSFQTDLGSISSEIQMLQEQSIAMNIRLKNRQAVRGELSQFVDEMVVSETMIG